MPGKERDLVWVFFIFCLVFAMFFDVLISGGTRVLSSPFTDIASQFLYFRDFGFGELKRGNLALWNPYLFSGVPFLGGFQSALLYPLNFPYLFLPIGYAINCDIVLHVFLLGVFMYAWARGRDLHAIPSFLSAILIVFSGVHFPHIYAGHLPNLCVMTWVPLIFLSLDKILAKANLKWILIGIFAVTMAVLAGHPQYVYYTFLTACIYGVFMLLFTPSPSRPILFLSGFFMVFIGGALLSSVQLLAGMEASREGIRAGGVPYAFAAMFSLPPENIFTLIFPNLFGDVLFHPYWGRTYYWEANLFIGIGGLTLVLYAFFKVKREAYILGALAFITLLFALGVHTPLFPLFYQYLPGFHHFRGTAKFIFFADLFLCLLAGMGLQALLREERGKIEKWVVPLLLGGAFMCVLASGLFYLMGGGLLPLRPWQAFLAFVEKSGESYLPQALYRDRQFAAFTSSLAAFQFLVSSIVFFLTALAWWGWVKKGKKYVYLIIFLASLEVMVFAGMTRMTFDLPSNLPPGLVKFLSGLNKEERVLNLWRPNIALTTRVPDIWGYDPVVSRRYGEFIAFTQGYEPAQASQYMSFNRYHPLLKLTRLRYIILPTPEGIKVREMGEVMPRGALIYRWKSVPVPEDILKEMVKPDFDLKGMVILEEDPFMTMEICNAPGSVSWKEIDTDTLLIEASVPCPAMLLITDSYARGWRASSVGQSSSTYRVLRADYAFMAIPLSPGYHKIKLEYAPRGFFVGRWISLAGLIFYLMALGYGVIRCHFR